MYVRGGGISTSQIIGENEKGKYAIDAVENNPSIEDTLANRINKLYNNLYYKAGDSMPARRVWLNGTLTSGSKAVFFTIPANIVTDATPKLNILVLMVRCNDIYIIGEPDDSYINKPTDFSGLEVSYVYHKEIGFVVTIVKEDSKYLDVNNVSLAITCEYKIDFV